MMLVVRNTFLDVVDIESQGAVGVRRTTRTQSQPTRTQSQPHAAVSRRSPAPSPSARGIQAARDSRRPNSGSGRGRGAALPSSESAALVPGYIDRHDYSGRKGGKGDGPKARGGRKGSKGRSGSGRHAAATRAPRAPVPSGSAASSKWVGVEEDLRTTVMLRELPPRTSRAYLLALLDAEGFNGAYDFVYLPVNFGSMCNFGYAFVNLVSTSEVKRFWDHFDGFSRWPGEVGQEHEGRVGQVHWSSPHQGKATHISRYRNSPLMHAGMPDEFRPCIFENGRRVPFPPPTKTIREPRIRLSRQRRDPTQVDGDVEGDGDGDEGGEAEAEVQEIDDGDDHADAAA